MIWILCIGAGFVGSRLMILQSSEMEGSLADRATLVNSELLSRTASAVKPPEETLAAARAMPLGPERRRLLGKALISHPETDPNKLLELVDEMGVWELDTRSKPSGLGREELLMASESPGINSWSTGVSSAETYGSRIRDYIQDIAKESPRDALNWLAKVDVPHEDALFQQLLTETLDLWDAQQPDAVEAWKHRFGIDVEEVN